MKDNDKGFITLGLAMAMLIVVSVLIITFSNPMLNTTKNIKGAEKNTEKYIRAIAGKERLHSKLKENISFKGVLNYNDLDSTYNVITLNEEYESKTLKFGQSGGEFEINNKSDINIKITSTPIDVKKVHSYDISVEYDGVDIVGRGGKSLSGNNNIKIGKDYLYNDSTDETNYGKYSIIVDSRNSNVSIEVSYNRLTKRELEVKGEDFDEVIIIENEEIGNMDVVKLYYQ